MSSQHLAADAETIKRRKIASGMSEYVLGK